MTRSKRTSARGAAQKGFRGARERQGTPGVLWLALGGLVLLIAGVLLIWRPGGGTPLVTGKPSLAVDRDRIDFGTVPMDKPVKAVFKLTNVGDKPLTINGQPQVEVVEGC